MLVQNAAIAPNVRGALSDGRELSLATKVDSYNPWASPPASALLRGVFALGTSDLSHMGSSSTRRLLRIDGCRLGLLTFDGLPFTDRSAGWQSNATGAITTYSASRLRCFDAPDAHLEIFTADYVVKAPSFDVVTSSQRVGLQGDALVRIGSAARTVTPSAAVNGVQGPEPTGQRPVDPPGNDCFGEVLQLSESSAASTPTPPSTVAPALAGPLPVKGLGGKAVALSVGFEHSCAIVGGVVRCWGSFTEFSDAAGDWVERSQPAAAKVRGLAAAASVASGGVDCAIGKDGTLRCWGNDSAGQLGPNASFGWTPSPVVVPGVPRPTAVAIGDEFICASLRDSTVRCWGNAKREPTEVPGLAGASTMLVAGSRHACALAPGGTVRCAVIRFASEPPGPVRSVSLPAAARVIAAVGERTCAALTDDSVACWTGNGEAVIEATQVGATGLALGTSHSCALLRGGTVSCWGANPGGQLGSGPGPDSTALKPVAALGAKVKAIAAGGNRTCALLNDGSIRCWGANGPT